LTDSRGQGSRTDHHYRKGIQQRLPARSATLEKPSHRGCPGTYDVEFDPTCQGSFLDSGYNIQWYKSVAAKSAATSVAVTANKTTTAINANLT
jgi:hypothetical protein